jgi:hypothetical protein
MNESSILSRIVEAARRQQAHRESLHRDRVSREAGRDGARSAPSADPTHARELRRQRFAIWG